jgi:hypothetical protein
VTTPPSRAAALIPPSLNPHRGQRGEASRVVMVDAQPGHVHRRAGSHANGCSLSQLLISASACSSQKRMSISRYIVVAVVRCSCASCSLRVRR